MFMHECSCYLANYTGLLTCKGSGFITFVNPTFVAFVRRVDKIHRKARPALTMTALRYMFPRIHDL